MGTKTNLQLAMDFTCVAEGGYTAINGGTMDGIEQATYDGWRTANNLPIQDVRLLTTAERIAIMRDNYWLPARCNLMPLRLAVCMFDEAFNAGVEEAVKILQYSIGDKVIDGQWGPNTQAALQVALMASEATLVTAYLARRDAVYEIIATVHPEDKRFLTGWENRVNEIKAYLKMLPA